MVGFTTAAQIFGQQNMTAKLSPSDEEVAKKVDEFFLNGQKDMPGGASVWSRRQACYKRAFGMANLITTFQHHFDTV